MSPRLPDTVALVTGAGSGIGRAVARRFAAEGARVVCAGRTPGPVEETARLIAEDGGAALAVRCDVTAADQVAAAVEQAEGVFGPVDVLVNNAGGSYGDDILAIEPETWDRNVDLVLKSVYFCCRAVLPAMLRRRRGSIVNVASVNGMTGIGEEAYGAAKAGMINLTQNLAVKYGRFGVRANVVAPATVRTPIWNARLAERPSVFEDLAAWYPLGRVGEPEDVANAVLFLASAEAAWITGVTLPVDGGLLAGSYRMTMDLSGAGADAEPPIPASAGGAGEHPEGGPGPGRDARWRTGEPNARLADAAALYAALPPAARRFLDALAEHPGERVSADAVAATIGVAGRSGLAGSLAAFSRGNGPWRQRGLPFRWEEVAGGPSVYWLEPEVAALFRAALERAV